MPSMPLLEADAVEALIGRILNVPEYNPKDLDCDKFTGGVSAVILVNAKHRNLIAAALRAFVEK